MTADQLRQALETYVRRFEAQSFNEWSVALPVLADAARSWLSLLEADEKYRAIIDARLSKWEFYDVRLRVNDETAWLRMTRYDFVRAVLAAIVGEEQE